MNPPLPEPAGAAPRRTGRVVLSLIALVVAPCSWFWAIDVAWLRATAATVWVLLALALALSLGAAVNDRRAWVRVVAGLELAITVLFLWLFFGFSRLPAVEPAQRAIDFTLPDERGQPVTLSAELARGPVLLVFYRGHW